LDRLLVIDEEELRKIGDNYTATYSKTYL
jgi:hypothetical protein